MSVVVQYGAQLTHAVQGGGAGGGTAIASAAGLIALRQPDRPLGSILPIVLGIYHRAALALLGADVYRHLLAACGAQVPAGRHQCGQWGTQQRQPLRTLVSIAAPQSTALLHSLNQACTAAVMCLRLTTMNAAITAPAV